MTVVEWCSFCYGLNDAFKDQFIYPNLAWKTSNSTVHVRKNRTTAPQRDFGPSLQPAIRCGLFPVGRFPQWTAREFPNLTILVMACFISWSAYIFVWNVKDVEKLRRGLPILEKLRLCSCDGVWFLGGERRKLLKSTYFCNLCLDILFHRSHIMDLWITSDKDICFNMVAFVKVNNHWETSTDHQNT